MKTTTLLTVLENKPDAPLLTARPDEPVLDAVVRMAEARVGSALVLADDKPLGIFTERDVLRRVVAAGRDATSTRVGDVMTQPVVCVRHSMTVSMALALCAQRQFRRLPVMKGARAVGILTLGDLMRWIVAQQEAQISALNDYIWGP